MSDYERGRLAGWQEAREAAAAVVEDDPYGCGLFLANRIRALPDPAPPAAPQPAPAPADAAVFERARSYLAQDPPLDGQLGPVRALAKQFATELLAEHDVLVALRTEFLRLTKISGAERDAREAAERSAQDEVVGRMEQELRATAAEAALAATNLAHGERLDVRRELDMLRYEHQRLQNFLRDHNFKPCDIAACNCGSWHERGPREEYDR